VVIVDIDLVLQHLNVIPLQALTPAPDAVLIDYLPLFGSATRVAKHVQGAVGQHQHGGKRSMRTNTASNQARSFHVRSLRMSVT